MAFWTNLAGTLETSFRIGRSKAVLDASGLTASRTITLRDAAGTMAYTSDFSGTNTGDETATSIGTLINGASAKDPLADADMFIVADSAASNLGKKHTWLQLKSRMLTYIASAVKTLTNTTFDTAGAGNVLQVSGVTVSANTGTGATMVRSVRPSITGGILGYSNAYPLMNYGGKNFNGTTTYLDGNALTGIADGKAGTFFVVLRFGTSAAGDMFIWHNTNSTFSVKRNAGGNIQIQATNAGGSSIMSLSTSGGLFSAAGTYALLASWDLAAGGGTARMYVYNLGTGVETSSATEVTYTNDTIDYTVAEHSVGGTVTGTSFFSGDIYSIWFDPTQRLEFDTESVRRKFVDASGTPVYLGFAGQLPTGSAPGVFHAYDDVNSWHINRGAWQSTSWTQNGAAATASTQLSGQWATLEDYGRTVTVTADYAVNRTDLHIINNRAATNTLTLPNAASNQGRNLYIQTIQAQTVVSASSNVIPETGAAVGTAILAATDGACKRLRANGTTWQAMLI